MKYERRKSAADFRTILPDLLERLNIKKEFSLEKLANEWDQIVGEMLAIHSYPSRINDDCLYIYSDHSVYSNELIMQKGYILKKINTLYLNKTVKQIRIETSRRR